MGHETAQISKSRLWVARIMSGLIVLFLLVDAVMKFIKPPAVVTATVGLGYPENTIVPIGLILLVCTVLYIIPRTSVLGAVLLTGYLGGAVATHLRVGAGLFPILFPVIMGLFVWGGLYLRDQRLSKLIPLRQGD
jgi:sorbitol-specific phosphotransferase system component IIC